MGNRTLRVNELLLREVSQYVHRQLQAEAVRVTIASVETSNDFKSAIAYFSMLGKPEEGPAMEVLLNRHAQTINQELRRTITLRNIPRIRFKLDDALERGVRVLRLLDELETDQKKRPPS
jgi:ribosome-binding factor A